MAKNIFFSKKSKTDIFLYFNQNNCFLLKKLIFKD